MTRDRRPAADSSPRPHLSDLAYTALRLHEAAIRRDGVDALNMEVAAASVDAAHTLLREAGRRAGF